MIDGLTEGSSAGLLSFAAAYAAMLVIPGPSFAVVSQASLSATRREGTLVAAGIACGASLLIALISRGAATLPATEAFAQVGRLACVVLLAVIGLRALKRALSPMLAPSERAATAPTTFFLTGLLTALTNPISFVFFSSAALAGSARGTASSEALLPAGVFVMAFAWFALIATLLSMPAIRGAFGRASKLLDAVMGVALLAIATRMLLAAA